MRRRTFEVDKAEARMMGVCAGLGRTFGIDPTIVRIALVVGTLIGGWPWTVVAYVLLAVYGRKPRSFRRGRGRGFTVSAYEARGFDRRLDEIDSYVASPNSRLAREIEELR